MFCPTEGDVDNYLMYMGQFYNDNNVLPFEGILLEENEDILLEENEDI